MWGVGRASHEPAKMIVCVEGEDMMCHRSHADE